MSLFGRKTSGTSPGPVPAADGQRMVSLRKEAAHSLKKHDITVDGTGGLAVYLVLDHSWSMEPFYTDGSVQRITEQALALSAEIDADGKIPVFYFASGVSSPLIASVDGFTDFVARTHTQEMWGSTAYETAIRKVAAYHQQHDAPTPGLVIFQTDGSPDSRAEAEAALREVSGLPLFFAFVGFGPKRNVQFLFELDEIEGRFRDNASAFHAADPQRVSDSALYDGVLGEFTRSWLPQVL